MNTQYFNTLSNLMCDRDAIYPIYLGWPHQFRRYCQWYRQPDGEIILSAVPSPPKNSRLAKLEACEVCNEWEDDLARIQGLDGDWVYACSACGEKIEAEGARRARSRWVCDICLELTEVDELSELEFANDIDVRVCPECYDETYADWVKEQKEVEV